MKLSGLVTTALLLGAVIAVQSSDLRKRSLLLPRLPEPCFTCRPEDRPLLYPLISLFTRVKDMLVRGVNALADNKTIRKVNV